MGYDVDMEFVVEVGFQPFLRFYLMNISLISGRTLMLVSTLLEILLERCGYLSDSEALRGFNPS